MNLVRYSGPASEPLDLASAKTHLRIDFTDASNDQYIIGLIKAAREFIEEETGYIFITSSWYAYLDNFPSGDRIYLPVKPVSAISKVEYYAEDDSTEYTEMSTSDYDAATAYNPACILLDEKPSVGDKLNAVRISFTAGNASAAACSAMSVHALKILLAHLYENRQEEMVGVNISRIEKGFMFLLDRLKVYTT